MIAAELRGGGKPSLNEALGWIGSRVDDVYGAAIGRLEDVWIDPATGEPRWLLVKEGRFGGRSTLVPFDQATPGDGNVWIPYERSVVREAPQIEPGVPLTQQVEATLRNHYAANAAAAVGHGSHRGHEEPPEAPRDSRATRATVRLATAAPDPEREQMPPPQLPFRPAPPIDVPPGPEQQPPPSGYEPPWEAPQPPAPDPFPPRPQADPGYRQQPPPPAQAHEPPQPPPAPQQPPAPQPSPQPAPQQVPPPPPPPQPQQFGYEPGRPGPAAAPPERFGYQPPSQHVPPPEPDPLDVLAGLPPGHMVEIELSGSLTISGELRHARIVPPDDPSNRR